jgi:fructose-1,6-bisphosphatase I
MGTDFLSSNVVTLSQFIRSNQFKHGGARGAFTNIMLAITLGTKVVSRGVARAGLAQMLGLTGTKNIQGEEVQKLDEYSDIVFSETVGSSGEFSAMVSEEQDLLFSPSNGDASSDYVIAFDPIDGSSNIDTNVSIGTIWGIYRRVASGIEADPSDIRDFKQAGRRQVAAGYAIYGSSTMFVFSTGDGVDGFTLDPTVGEFVLTHPKLQMPKVGNYYSCNEGNYMKWSKGVKAYVDHLKGIDGNGDRCSARYIGSLVADFHRTLLKGGIFMYPGDDRNKNGKLRHLYECAPLAFLAEQAGGKASNGSQRILDVTPNSIHQRSPLYIGSATMVDEVERYIAERDR